MEGDGGERIVCCLFVAVTAVVLWAAIIAAAVLLFAF